MIDYANWENEPHGMGAVLSYHAASDPGHPAVTFEDTTMSRAELDAGANRMARALADHGVRQDDIVAIVLANGFMHHIVAFAIWKLGASPLPLSPSLPDPEMRAILELAQPRLVIGIAAGRIPGMATLPADFEPDSGISDAPMPEIVATHWKTVTSGGSTGRPKLIRDAQPSVVVAGQPSSFIHLQKGDVVLHPAPLYHNAPFSQTNWCLSWGLHIIELAKFDALRWLEAVERYRVTWAYLVPTMMNRIWALPEDVRNRYDLSSLRIAMHMAAPCPVWLKRAWIDWLGGERIYEVYAATEAIGFAMVNGTEWLGHPGTVGKPGVEARILDEDGNELPIGEIGEIWFRPPTGPGSTYTYVGAESRVRGDWEGSGDLGYLDADGYLYLSDRRTDMIVSGGANIYPAEIEAAVEEHPAVAAAAVVGLPHAELGRVPHLILELRAGCAEPSPREIETFLTARLARYKLPYTIEFVAEPLRSDAGKMQRKGMRDAREAQLASGVTFTPLRAHTLPNA